MAIKYRNQSVSSPKMNESRQQLIDTVLQSPAAVKAHDRKAWISIFAKQNVVEDPVGSKPHHNGVFDPKSGRRGNAALERFFDTFIAPNEINFHVDRDIVCDTHVVRDLTIEIKMSEKIIAHVPMHLLYELSEENGEFKISRLAAHWELWPMIKQLLSKGFACGGVLSALGLRMMSIQGPGGAIGFMQGFKGIGNQGKDAVMAFAGALNNQQLGDMMGLFSGGNRGINFPYGGKTYSPDDIVDQASAKVSFKKLLAAGYVISCSVELEQDGLSRHGVALFEFNAKTKKIEGVDFYWDAEV